MSGYLKPWMLVVTGILFNIAAAIITHYFIGINNQKLNKLEMRAAQHDTLIESQWRSKTEIQRMREFLLLLLAQKDVKTDEGVHKIILNQLTDTIKLQNLEASLVIPGGRIDFDMVEQVSAQASRKIIASINDTYLEKLDILQQVDPLQKNNALLFSVSIFLQLTGLILVLAKDIFR